jgi:hypothetical protein
MHVISSIIIIFIDRKLSHQRPGPGDKLIIYMIMYCRIGYFKKSICMLKSISSEGESIYML